MSARKRVSVVVPALNEENNLRAAVASVIEAASAADCVALEIIIVNDGSTDGTAAVTAALEAEYPFVRSVHHAKNEGFGAAFRSGLEVATHEWITLSPGDNVVSTTTLREMLKYAGRAELVCAYLVNSEHRSRIRNILSSIYSSIYTLTFNVHLRYIHATPVYSVERLRRMTLRCRRYSFPSEITIKLLREGCTFMELPGYMNPTQRKSSALRLKNLAEVLISYVLLIFEIFVSHREHYSRVPLRVIPDEMTPAGLRTPRSLGEAAPNVVGNDSNLVANQDFRSPAGHP